MKRIVIIGASSGIGYRAAVEFAQMGWQVGAAARRSDRLQQLWEEDPKHIITATIDVTADDAPKRLTDLIDVIGGMDVLLYCAGCGWGNPELDLQQDMQTVAVNVGGFTRVVNTAYRYFRDNASTDRRGQIAVITSVAGTKGLGAAPAYSASKSYQQTYLQALDQLRHMQHVPVDITDIRPGFIDTDLLAGNRNYPLLMSPAYAVPRIVRAVLRRRRVAVIDWRWGIVTSLWRMIPNCLWPLIPVKTTDKKPATGPEPDKTNT